MAQDPYKLLEAVAEAYRCHPQVMALVDYARTLDLALVRENAVVLDYQERLAALASCMVRDAESYKATIKAAIARAERAEKQHAELLVKTRE